MHAESADEDFGRLVTRVRLETDTHSLHMEPASAPASKKAPDHAHVMEVYMSLGVIPS
jgi:hypothetical protein